MVRRSVVESSNDLGIAGQGTVVPDELARFPSEHDDHLGPHLETPLVLALLTGVLPRLESGHAGSSPSICSRIRDRSDLSLLDSNDWLMPRCSAISCWVRSSTNRIRSNSRSA